MVSPSLKKRDQDYVFFDSDDGDHLPWIGLLVRMVDDVEILFPFQNAG